MLDLLPCALSMVENWNTAVLGRTGIRFESYAREPRIGAIMVRYNAAHVGAAVRSAKRTQSSAVGLVDRLMGAHTP
jgi:hypothetical protein